MWHRPELRVDVRGRDARHALQFLQAALRLARLRGLGAKACHEALDLLDALLLLLECLLLAGELLGALAFEGRIVAAVQAERAALEGDDAVAHVVEEIAVVRDQDQRAGIAREPRFQPHQRVEVEVVGGLVEQHQVAGAHQRARQR